MKDKAILIGSGDMGKVVQELEAKGITDVVVVSPEQAKELQYPFSDPIIYRNFHPPLHSENKFICKGRHEYREKDGKWICQCGRTL